MVLVRSYVIAFLVLLFGAAAASAQQAPILFVHGNGDYAALWTTTLWRFESNGWNPRRLYTIDFPNPTARNDDGKPQANRSSSADQMAALKARVDAILAETRAAKIILVGSSRGGLAIRNYLQNGGGAARVSHAILAGTPNHGVIASDTTLVGSEFNGNSPFLRALNAIPDEVVKGVRYLTMRSDSQDKFATPDGRYLGLPNVQTNITAEGPALKGAKNVVLPGLDHREVAFHEKAFAEMYKFLTGREPRTLAIVAQKEAVLDGMVGGVVDGVYTNLPVAGATVEVFQVSPVTGERTGPAKHAKTTGADGRWGPFKASPHAYYEFVLAMPGQPITHIYRSPFPRSSAVVHLRPGRLTEADRGAGSVVTISRPRGYFGHGRDTFALDGKVPPGIPGGVPNVSTGTLRVEPGPIRPMRAVFDDERLTVLTWPATENHVVIAEFHD